MKDVKRLTILLVALFLVQCQTEKDTTFLITKDSVGKLNRSTTVDMLSEIYATDSIVGDTTQIKLGNTSKKIKIYEKGGQHLLTLTPKKDSIKTIENIRIFDKRFTTDKGVGLGSNFKDIQNNYVIKKVVTSMNNVVVFIKENELYFTIDKKELPANLRFTRQDIEVVQIPDEAKIKYLMMGW